MSEKYVYNEQFIIEEQFIYVSSPASKSKNKFIKKKDCIENSYNEEIKDIPYQMHVGITACEGINQFYEFEIE